MAASSSSSQGPTTGIQGKRRQTPGDLILYFLEDLKGYEFRRFKGKLSDLLKLSIPRGKLENADWITTKDLLIDTYGEEGALDVMSEVFTLIDLMGPAKDLQEQRAKNAKMKLTTLDNSVTEWRKEYMESMKEDFQRIKEYNSRIGEAISLQKRYTKLLLIKGPRNVDEKTDEMGFLGSKHVQIMEKRSSDDHSPTTIQTLFDLDEENFTPKIVVLQGPAGIGKTMTSKKIMLDWASGDLYQDKFDFVFYLSCRELNNIKENISLVGLLSRTCKLQSSDDLVSLLKNPGSQRKILFLIDGFDELRWTLEKKSKVCHNVFEETHIEILLQRLLRKQILKKCSLIITTRPLALEKLDSVIDDSRNVEILGFTGEDRKEYFHSFFKNDDDAEKALGIIKDNDVLYTMCAVPIVCWIVCTVMKPQIKQDLDIMQYKTATSVYLLYLKGLIKYHGRNQPAHTCLKKLCALANGGVLNQQILFEEDELERHGLSMSEIESVFLNENVFHLDIDTKIYYGFIHLSVQEFFAALHYALDDGPVEENDSFLPEICKGDSISTLGAENPHLTLAVQFLFGLLNEKGAEAFSKSTGINISLQARSAVEKWLMGDRPSVFSTQAIFCLYETQDTDFIRKIMSCSPCLEIETVMMDDHAENCFKQLCYCLKICENFQSLTFWFLTMEPSDQEILLPFLHNCQLLCFKFCEFPQKNYSQIPHDEDLPTIEQMLHSTAYEKNEEEGEFTFSDDEESTDLSWFTNPQSKIQELTLYSCSLTSSSCESICSIMSTNKQLTSLDLTYNMLLDSGVKILCKGLKDPGCTLQELSLRGCELSARCCDDLRSVLTTNRSLIKLDLSFNNLEDPGLKVLCDGVRDPGCSLQTFIFDDCEATLSCCDDLQSVITANHTLTTLETRLSIDMEESEADVERWCEVLRQLGCAVEKEATQMEIKYRRTTLQN